MESTVTAVSEWQEVNLTIPAKGVTSTVRLHLPGEAATEFQTIEFSGKNGSRKPWKL